MEHRASIADGHRLTVRRRSSSGMKCKVRRHVAASKGPVAQTRGQPPQFPSDAAIGRCSTGCNRDQTPLSRCVGHRPPLSRPRLTYKEYFPYESQCGRREPRRRHARACPRRVCWPLCAWTIRATIRGARPYGLRCLHWDPRRNAHGVCQMLYRHGWSVTL